MKTESNMCSQRENDVFIEVNDIFDELNDENKRSVNELNFANISLNVLLKCKNTFEKNL